MSKSRRVNVNGNAGAYVDIQATMACRGAEIIEDDSLTAQGLTFKLPADGFVQEYNVALAREPIQLGNAIATGAGSGDLLGLPANGDVGAPNRREADVLIKLRSATVTATAVRVTEID